MNSSQELIRGISAIELNILLIWTIFSNLSFSVSFIFQKFQSSSLSVMKGKCVFWICAQEHPFSCRKHRMSRFIGSRSTYEKAGSSEFENLSLH